jgi:hypothetical protein
VMLEDPRPAPSPRMVSLEQLQWRPWDDLPHERLRITSAQEQAYRRELEGQPARYALRRANYFFVRRADGLDGAIRP